MRFIVPGRVEVPVAADSADVGVRVEVKHAVRLDASRGAEEVELEVADDDLVQVTLDGGAVVWLRPDEIEKQFGVETTRAGGVPRLPAEIDVGRDARGPVKWIIKGLAVIGVDIAGGTAMAVAKRVEDKVAKTLGLWRWAESGALEAAGKIEADTAKPYLLFLHGTASHTLGSFDALRSRQAAVWSELRRAYGDRVLAFEHRSLTESPVKNALDLVADLPEGVVLHVVSHSRGGLVGELLGRGTLRTADGSMARAAFTPNELDIAGSGLGDEMRQLSELLARKRIVVEKFVRVACPARGTVLIDGRQDRWLNLLFNVAKLATSATVVGSEIVEGLRDLTIATVQKGSEEDVLPGLAAMVPDQSPLLRILNQPTVLQDDGLTVIAGDCEAEGLLKKLALFFADLYFGTDHDLVVNTASMDGGAPRPQPRAELLDRSADVSHFNYFANLRTARAIADALRPKQKVSVPTPEARREESRVLPLGSRGSTNRPLVFVLPGISGSQLAVGGKQIWIDFLRLAAGGVLKLGIDTPGIVPTTPIERYYGDLCDFLRGSHDVDPIAYDWRKTIPGLAEGFSTKLREALAARPDQPVHIVAHSMGGLVARTAFLINPDLWKSFREHRKRSRLLMLGTPNGGSYSMPLMLLGRNTLMQWLARLDLTAGPAEHLAVAATWDGALQMLPGDKLELCERAWWDALPDRIGDGPAARALTRAKQFIEGFRDAPLDADCMAYIAGQADTYATVEVVDGKTRFGVTPEGDGAVLWRLGIPAKPDGTPALPTWFTRIEHGDLARRQAIFPAILSILTTGTTAESDAISRRPPTAVRSRGRLEQIEDAPIPSGAPRDWIEREPIGLEPSPELLAAQAVGGSTVPDGPAAPAKVTVRVLHCDLRHANYPVMVGHYTSDTIAGTEKILDLAQEGRIERRRRRGLHPGAIESYDVHLDPNGKHIASLIVGLGQVTELTSGALTRTVRRGLLGLADAMQEQGYESGRRPGRGVSMVMVGSGGGVVSLADSIAALLRALAEANSVLRDKSGDGDRCFTDVEIVEVDEQKAITAWHLLRRMLTGQVGAEVFQLDGGVHAGVGGWRRIGPDESERDWFISVKVVGDTEDTLDGPEDVLRYEVAGGYARVEAKLVGTQRRLVDDLIKEVSGHGTGASGYTPGRTLFELLWPRELKDHSLDDRSIRLQLNAQAAALPWEMLDDRRGEVAEQAGARLQPPAVRFKLVRQLVVPDARPARRRSGPGRTALVIGDPRGGNEAAGLFPPLPFARQEAALVRTLLNDAGYKVTPADERSSPFEVQSALLSEAWDIIHIAAHGVVGFESEEPDPKAPEGKRKRRQTGVVLGSKDGVQVIGPDFFEKLQTAPDIVFLNCCLLGGIKGGDELFRERPRLAGSLAAELIRQGAQTVVAAGWEVDDFAARSFSETFYREMLAGGSFGGATLAARRAAFEAKSGGNTWGAYQCYGDADMRLPEGFFRAPRDTRLAFAAPSEAISHLDRIVATASVEGGLSREKQIAWLETVETAIGAHGWGARGDVLVALGDARRAFGESAVAIDCYTRATESDEGAVTIRSVEARFELMANPGSGRSASAADVAQAIKRLSELSGVCGATWARHCLLAECHARQAELATGGGEDPKLRVQRDQALKKMVGALADAVKIGGERTPPVGLSTRGRLLAVRLLQALRQGKGGEAKKLARQFRDGLKLAGWSPDTALLLDFAAEEDLRFEELERLRQVAREDAPASEVRELAALFRRLLDDDDALAARLAGLWPPAT